MIFQNGKQKLNCFGHVTVHTSHIHRRLQVKRVIMILLNVLKEVSSALQGCIYLIKSEVVN